MNVSPNRILSFTSLVLVAAFLTPEIANAQQRRRSSPVANSSVKVLKAKGSKAIVQFGSNVRPQNGDTYKLNLGGNGDSMDLGDGSMEAAPMTGGWGRRAYLIELNSSVTKTVGAAGIGASFSAGGGFNLGSLEFGARLGFVKDSNFSGGIFGAFNFVKNEAPETFIPGIGLKAGIAKPSGVTGITIDFGLSLFTKLFVLGQSSSAITIAIPFDFEKTAAGLGKSFGLSLGISTYF